MEKLRFEDLPKIVVTLFPDPTKENTHDTWIDIKDRVKYKQNWKRYRQRAILKVIETEKSKPLQRQ